MVQALLLKTEKKRHTISKTRAMQTFVLPKCESSFDYTEINLTFTSVLKKAILPLETTAPNCYRYNYCINCRCFSMTDLKGLSRTAPEPEGSQILRRGHLRSSVQKPEEPVLLELSIKGNC